MQRYHPANCTGAVNNNAIGGTSGRADSSSLSNNFSVGRRQPPLGPYKLRCDKEPLNSRLGPPDFHPQTPNCPEETLTREYVQSGYRDSVEGVEEVREISLTQVQAFSKPVTSKCREALRKYLRAINDSRAQKRKAGQVYGVPLSGSLLTKPGAYPEQRACGEEFKKKWIEGLSQPHKRLCHLVDHVPHGYRKKSLFEVLIGNNVPLPRATWFIKITYLNQVRPTGTTDKSQLLRSELWTKDVVDYLQMLLDELLSRNGSHRIPHNRDRSAQMLSAASAQQNGEDPSIHFKWWYMVRLLHWHYSEGLLLPSVIIDWVLNQLQEKDLLEILQLLLPIIYGVLDAVVLSQTYVHTLLGIAIRYISQPSPGGSDLVDNSRRAYTTAAVIEMLRYLILAVPDTFVALDCFPLPPSIVSYSVNEGAFMSKASDETRKIKDSSAGFGSVFKSKGLDAQYQSVSFGQVVSSIQKRADNIAMATCPGYLVHSVAKAVQALDKALLNGDVREAYSFLFENFCDGAVDDGWIEEVSPCLKSSLKWISTVNLSYVCSVFFLCEWATCDYRDFRTAAPHDLKFTGRKDLSQVYIAARLLKLKLRDFQSKSRRKNERLFRGNNLSNSQHNSSVRDHVGSSYDIEDSSRSSSEKTVSLSDVYESPGPLHDIIVCWIDQHEVQKGEGSKRLQLFMGELIRSGIFYPQSYARQLLISGIMDTNVPATDLDRRKRHYQILKQLPGNFLQDILEEAKIAEDSELSEAINVYSNERRLLLHGALCKQYQYPAKSSVPIKKEKHNLTSVKDNPSLDQLKAFKTMLGSGSLTLKKADTNARIEGLKASISLLLQIPNLSASSETGMDESQGSVKRAAETTSSTVDSVEATPGCEDCKRAKKQKLSDGRSSSLQGQSPILDNEDTWWTQKESKTLPDSSKVDMPLKTSKPVTKSRQKIVRKTQSLAQLAAARIEGSHGASTSHVCNNRVSCPHHRTGLEGETLKPADAIRTLHGGDIVVIAKELKKLRFVEKRCITVWLLGVVKQLVGDTEKNTAKVGPISRPSVPADDKSSIQWKLGEDELSAILYLMDVCNDFVSASKLLLWLLPKVASNPNSTILTGRNMMMLQKNGKNHPCEVGEVFLLSCFRRYENVLVATDLIPDVLEIALQRVAVLLASSGRVSGSAALTYSRHLLKKYGNLPSVSEWEKNFLAKCDKRLVSELDPGRPQDREFGYPLGVPAGIEDLDDFFRQKITGNRMSRAGMSMKELVQRHIQDAFNYFSGGERKLLGSTPKGPGLEKSDGGHQIAQQIVIGLMECIRQTGGAAQEGDPSLVSSAVAAIVSNVGPTMAKMPDITTHSNATSATASLSIAGRILCIHVRCLCLLKEAFGERQSRVFEVALATEASFALAAAFAHGKASRSQFQLSPDENISSEASARAGRGTKSVAAISALVVGAVIHGVTSLERIITVFRLKEGLDEIQFIRNTRSNSNGNVRSVLGHKADNSIEIYVHWFRLFIGNCRTLSDGLIVELLGEPSIVALSRMQRMLPLSLVFPPAYSVFAFVVWRQIILSKDLAIREDINQLYQSLTVAITDAIKHLPFRDVCLRDSQGFYDLVVADVCGAEFASMLNGLDVHTKSSAFIPLRGRLFLNSIIDCKIPLSVSLQEENNSRVSGNKIQHGENGVKLLEKLVNGLDTLQPARFHWQWVELRLLLNEQALIEKLETHDMSLVDAIRSSSPGPEKSAASENENNFIVIILTRLLVRPDAAPLFSELVHLFGRSLEDSMLLQAKWFLGGHDVLFGKKTIRQRLTNIAESKNLSMKFQFSKPWGWHGSSSEPVKGGKKKLEATSLEEGEVVEDTKRIAKGSNQKQYMTERAFIELVLPCIDQGSDESRNTFASDLIKQLNNIEQQINAAARGASKQAGSGSSGFEGPAIKGNNRKVTRGGSPGMSRRATVTADSSLPSPAALRASMSLRLQLLLRMLPVICANGEPSGKNMRHMLASVIIRLLGNRIVHEDADLSLSPFQGSQSKIEAESAVEFASADLSGEFLFDRLLVVLHALLSNALPNWLKPRSASKLNELSKESAGVDRDVVESLQNELDRMQLPGSVRWRIQAAMPILLPSVRFSLSCQIPTVPVAAVASLQQNATTSGPYSANPPQKNTNPLPRTMNLPVKSKPSTVLPTPQDNDPEIDPWSLLEDGAGSSPSSGNASVAASGDQSNLRASCLLKGAVRVRRTDLSYIGSVDDDS